MAEDDWQAIEAAEAARQTYENRNEDANQAARQLAMLVSDHFAEGRLTVARNPAHFAAAVEVFNASWLERQAAKDAWYERVAALDVPPSPVT